MTLIRNKVPALLLAALIAIALTIAMGMTAQNAYAEVDPVGGYEVNIEGVHGVVPGETMDNIKATVTLGGQPVDVAAEGLHIEWSLGLLGPGEKGAYVEPVFGGKNPDSYVRVEDDTTVAKIVFKPSTETVDETFGLTAELKKGNTPLATSDGAQFQLSSMFYEVKYEYENGENIDPYMFTGDEQWIRVNVISHKAGEQAKPVAVTCEWGAEDGIQVLDEAGKPVTSATGENMKFTFLRTDSGKEAEVHLQIFDPAEISCIEDIYFPFYEIPTDLSDYQFSFNGTDGFPYFVDKADLPIYAGSAKFEIKVVTGSGEAIVLPSDKYDLKIQKVVGHDETTYDEILEDTDFPLDVEPAGAVNRNGTRVDGTRLYFFTAIAKPGSGFKGQTTVENGMLWLTDRKTLIFPATLSGFSEKYYNEDQDRYEVKKGTKLTPYVYSLETYKNYTLNKEYTARYVNNKTSRVVTSFPTAVGHYTVVLSGKSPYYGEIDDIQLMVGKANTLKAKGKTIVCKAKLKKKKTTKKKTFKASKAIKVTKAKGTVSYSKVSGNKLITVAESGKVTVKKGIKKGTYKVRVKVTAQGNDTYIAGSKTVTVKVKVKKK